MASQGVDLRRYAAGQELASLLAGLTVAGQDYRGVEVRTIDGLPRRSVGIDVLGRGEARHRPRAGFTEASVVREHLYEDVPSLGADFPITAVRAYTRTNRKTESFVIVTVSSDDTLDFMDEREDVDESLNRLLGKSADWNDRFQVDLTLAYVPHASINRHAAKDLLNLTKGSLPLPMTLRPPTLDSQ